MRALILAVSLAAGAAAAQPYRCEADGRVTYQATPCPGGKPVWVPAPRDPEAEAIAAAISRGGIVPGMTIAQVWRSWGQPLAVNRVQEGSAVREQWVYRRNGVLQHVTIAEGKVTAVQTPVSPAPPGRE